MLSGIFVVAILTSIAEAVGESDKKCVEIGGGEFTCTRDTIMTREIIDRPKNSDYVPIDQQITGVEQRIDGSESEKKAIKEILIRMDNYFIEEVLAIPDYESVRYNW